ncbi:hypothetical protein PTKIN_Ptkin02bG0075200 [Pterospermum kingtungense]
MVCEAMVVLGTFSASEYFSYVGWIVDRLTGLHGRIERIFHKLDGFLEQLIDDHLKPELSRDDDHEDILDVLLRLHKDGVEFGGTLLNKDSIKALILDLFTVGIETNAATIMWAMAEGKTRMVELALANLLHYFDWKIPFGMEGKMDIYKEEAAGPSLTISKKTPLHLVPVNRVQRSLEDK